MQVQPRAGAARDGVRRRDPSFPSDVVTVLFSEPLQVLGGVQVQTPRCRCKDFRKKKIRAWGVEPHARTLVAYFLAMAAARLSFCLGSKCFTHAANSISAGAS